MNVAAHLRAACNRLETPFVWCDDDTFTLKPWTPGVYVRPFSIAHMYKRNTNRGYWTQAVRASIRIMEGWGFDPADVPCGTTHRPWMVEPQRALMTLDALDAVGGGSFKALYVVGLDGVVEATDYKITSTAPIRPDVDVVSLHPLSWAKNAGRIIRETFPTASRWETDQPVDMGRLRGGRVAAGGRRNI